MALPVSGAVPVDVRFRRSKVVNSAPAGSNELLMAAGPATAVGSGIPLVCHLRPLMWAPVSTQVVTEPVSGISM